MQSTRFIVFYISPSRRAFRGLIVKTVKSRSGI